MSWSGAQATSLAVLWPFQLLLLWLGNVRGFCLRPAVGKVCWGCTAPDATGSSPCPKASETCAPCSHWSWQPRGTAGISQSPEHLSTSLSQRRNFRSVLMKLLLVPLTQSLLSFLSTVSLSAFKSSLCFADWLKQLAHTSGTTKKA